MPGIYDLTLTGKNQHQNQSNDWVVGGTLNIDKSAGGKWYIDGVEVTATAAALSGAGQGRLWYASQNGVTMDADLSNPAIGTDVSAALQTLINTVAAAGGGTIVIDGACKCGDVLIKSKIKIRGLQYETWTGVGTAPTCGVIAKPHSQCVFGNFNRVSNYNNGSPVSDYSLVQDYDITIEDRGYGQTADACNFTHWADQWSATGGKFIYALDFNGVRDIRLKNVWIYDYIFCCNLTYIDGAIIENLTQWGHNPTYDATRVQTSNGCVFIGPARRIFINNCVSNNTDDTWMFQADPSATFYPNDNYKARWYSGDITGVRITNLVHIDPNGPVITMYSGSPRGQHLVDDFQAHNVSTGTWVLMESLGAAANFGRILLKDFHFTGEKALYAQTLANNTHLVIDGATLTHVTSIGAGVGDRAASFEFASSIPYHIDMRNISIEDQAATAGTLVYIEDPRFFTLDSVTWNRTQAVKLGYPVAGVVCQPKLATNGEVSVTNVRTRYVANIVKFLDASVVLGLYVNGLSHVLPGNNPAVYFDTSGASVARMRAGSCNTVCLTNRPGNATGLRTDSLEDQTQMFDGFVDTDNTDLTAHTADSGGVWTSVAGTIATKIVGVCAQVTANGGSGYALYTKDSTISDFVYSVVMPNNSIVQSLVFRYVDVNNYWRAEWSPGGGTVSLLEVTAGVQTNRGILTVSVGASFLFVVKAVGTLITVSAQSVVDQTFPSVSFTSSVRQSATIVGLRGTVGSQFKNALVDKP